MPDNFGFSRKKADVIQFADRCKTTDYQLTLTGSYLQDQEEHADFWDDVFLWWYIQETQERAVEATLNKANELYQKLHGKK